MNEKKYGLLDMMQHVNEQIIYETGQPWKGKKKSFARSTGTRVAGVLLVLALGITGIFHEQVEAAISGISAILADYLGNSRDLSPYVKEVNQTQTDNGIQMTLKEVVMDTNRILVSASLSFGPEASEKADEFENLFGYIGSAWIDGTYLEGIMNIGAETEEPDNLIFEYDFEGDVSEDMSEVELLIWLGDHRADGTIEPAGEFRFTFEATKEQLQATTKTIPLDADLDAGDGLIFHLEELSYTDLGGRIRVSCSEDPRVWYGEGEGRYYDIPYDLQIRDNQNNWTAYQAAGNYYEAEECTELLFDSTGGNPPADDTEYLEISLRRNDLVPASEKEEAKETEEEAVVTAPETVAKVRVDLK